MQTPIPKAGPVPLKGVWDSFFEEATPRSDDYSLTLKPYFEMGVMNQAGSNCQKLLGKALAFHKGNAQLNSSDGDKYGNFHVERFNNPPSAVYRVDGGHADLRDPNQCYFVQMMGGYPTRSAINCNISWEVKNANGTMGSAIPMKYSVELNAVSNGGDSDAACYVVVVGYSDRRHFYDATVVCNDRLTKSTGSHSVFTGTFSTVASLPYYSFSMQRNNSPNASSANEYSARWSSVEVEIA